MFSRGALAALDHNSNTDREQVGFQRLRFIFENLCLLPRATQPAANLVKQRHGKTYFVKVVKERKDHSFRDVMASLTIQVDLFFSFCPFF